MSRVTGKFMILDSDGDSLFDSNKLDSAVRDAQVYLETDGERNEEVTIYKLVKILKLKTQVAIKTIK